MVETLRLRVEVECVARQLVRSRSIGPGAKPSVRNCYVAVTRMPTVDRIKTAKVTFAVATPYRSLIVTDRCRVPAPAMSKIALGVPARKVRGVTMMFLGRERIGW